MLSWGMHTNNCSVIFEISFLILALAFIVYSYVIFLTGYLLDRTCKFYFESYLNKWPVVFPGLVADVDIESEKYRWIGSARLDFYVCIM